MKTKQALLAVRVSGSLAVQTVATQEHLADWTCDTIRAAKAGSSKHADLARR